MSPNIVLDDAASDTIFNFNLSIERKCSDVSYVKNLPVTELLQNEDEIFHEEFIDENDEEDELSFKDAQVKCLVESIFYNSFTLLNFVLIKQHL